jgi:hypothetical protein
MTQTSVLEPAVAADSSAEYVIWRYLRDIRRMDPPLQQVAKPKCGNAVF